MAYKHVLTKEELRYRQSLPLSIKERMSLERIREFCNMYGVDGVYVSFSGGLDSLVTLHLSRRFDSNIKGVFIDTWLEQPEIRKFVRCFSNIDVIKPEKDLKTIVNQDGWCFPSKDISEAIESYRLGKKWAVNKLNGLDKNGNPSKYRERYKKWLYVAENCPEKISHRCCLDSKEIPVRKYEKRTGRNPIMGLRAEESARRTESYLRTGCLSFSKRPVCKPLGFWTKQDVLEYIVKYKIPFASPYGSIIIDGQLPGQVNLFDLVNLNCSSCYGCKYRTSGEERTGCVFCPVGYHLQKEKFNRLRAYNPKLYDYCMEELGEKRLFEWVDKHLN